MLLRVTARFQRPSDGLQAAQEPRLLRRRSFENYRRHLMAGGRGAVDAAEPDHHRVGCHARPAALVALCARLWLRRLALRLDDPRHTQRVGRGHCMACRDQIALSTNLLRQSMMVASTEGAQRTRLDVPTKGSEQTLPGPVR